MILSHIPPQFQMCYLILSSSFIFQVVAFQEISPLFIYMVLGNPSSYMYNPL